MRVDDVRGIGNNMFEVIILEKCDFYLWWFNSFIGMEYRL